MNETSAVPSSVLLAALDTCSIGARMKYAWELNSQKKMLRYFLFPKLTYYPENFMFQQGGAQPHYFIEVRECLDR